MADELDERASHELAEPAPGSDHVDDGQHRIEEAHGHRQKDFEDDVPTPEAEKSLVPERRQQLLAVGVRDELKFGEKCTNELHIFISFQE